MRHAVSPGTPSTTPGRSKTRANSGSRVPSPGGRYVELQVEVRRSVDGGVGEDRREVERVAVVGHHEVRPGAERRLHELVVHVDVRVVPGRRPIGEHEVADEKEI